tara:strand:- start:191 stop:889 length:699 start_codon:yes stop_codon:yes gene_type:complete
MNKKDIIPPKKDLSNKVHEYINEVTKTVTGGFINPLVDFVLPSLHQKRFENWCNNIHSAIIELEEKKISGEDIISNEEFISLLKESVSLASKTHQEEKHQLLKNALINNFESNFTFDSKLIFTRLIGDLTITHLYFLKLIDKYSEKIKDIKLFSEIKNILKRDSLSAIIPNNSYRIILNDLEKFNLIATGDITFETVVRKPILISSGKENFNLPYITITDFGKEFIEYIKNE